MSSEGIDRRRLLIGGGAAIATGGLLSVRVAGGFQPSPAGAQVSVADFGARSGSGNDNTRAIQAAIDHVQSRGGGTVLIPGRYRCGNIVISGRNVRLQGQDGVLADGRLIIGKTASNITVTDLQLIETRGDKTNYLMEIFGSNCAFDNVELVKDPPTRGFQMYIRQSASGCRFTRFRMRGSKNGMMVSGTDHLFDGFEIETREALAGADDAIAINGLGGITDGITIRNGTIHGHTSIVAIGSAIGETRKESGKGGAVRNVLVENVIGDRCARVAFIKPDALKYDWRNGIVEGIALRNLTLTDLAGETFVSGIEIVAGRGATVRDVTASAITIRARARTDQRRPTGAVLIGLKDIGEPAKIENINIQLVFADPYSGAAHGARAPGYPIDYAARVTSPKTGGGTISGIVLDLEVTGTSWGGICVGGGLDGAVDVRRARLSRVAMNPKTKICAGGIWSASRLTLGDVQVDAGSGKKLAGPAFGDVRQ
jgi:hypothetical protein